MDRRRVLFLAASLLGLVWVFPVNVALGEGAASISVSGDIITKETEPHSIDVPAADKTEIGEIGKDGNDKNDAKTVGVTKTEGTLEDKETVKNKEEPKIEELVINKENVRMRTDMSQDTAIYRVSFPTDIKATLDPGNVSGSGQVFSDRYKVENYGNTDVAIKIKNINVWYASEEELYVFTEEEVKDRNSGIKKLHINMVWESEDGGWVKEFPVSEGAADECVLVLKAAQYDDEGNFISVGEGGSGFFFYTGSMSADPKLSWEPGECTLQFEYELLGAGKEESQDNGDKEIDGEKERRLDTEKEVTTEKNLSGEKAEELSSEKETIAEESSKRETMSEDTSSGEITSTEGTDKKEG